MGISKDQFLKEFDKVGYVIVDNVFEEEFLIKVKNELEIALIKEVEYVGTTDYKFYGYVLSNAKYGGSFFDVLANKTINKLIDWVMGENSILYSYTSSSMPPRRGNDASHLHVDCPIFLQDYILRMGVLLPVVDFTEENGAPFYLKGSHKSEHKPDNDTFYREAQRLVLKAGQGVFFNTRVWHAGGVNETSEWRHALTLNICRPWMKQYLDIPRLLSDVDMSEVPEKVKQKLGFYSQPPVSYEEYYDSNRKRLYF